MSESPEAAPDTLSAAELRPLLVGDEAAWQLFIQTYERRIYSYLYRLEGHEADALDLTQEVFYRAWRSIRTFRAGERVMPWLFQIARNTQIERHRKKQLPRFSIDEAQEEVGFEVPAVQRGPEAQAESVDSAERVQRALLRLPEEYREAVVLRFVEDLSYDEIAQVQGVAVGTAKSRVFRAKEQLAGLLAGRVEVD